MIAKGRAEWFLGDKIIHLVSNWETEDKSVHFSNCEWSGNFFFFSQNENITGDVDKTGNLQKKCEHPQKEDMSA